MLSAFAPSNWDIFVIKSYRHTYKKLIESEPLYLDWSSQQQQQQLFFFLRGPFRDLFTRFLLIYRLCILFRCHSINASGPGANSRRRTALSILVVSIDFSYLLFLLIRLKFPSSRSGWEEFQTRSRGQNTDHHNGHEGTDETARTQQAWNLRTYPVNYLTFLF